MTVKARFVHFKPLFFQYGKDAGYFPVGSIKIYDNATDEEVCDLKLGSRNAQFVSDNTYMTMFFEPLRRTIDKTTGEISLMTTYYGHFIWDDSCGNMVVAVHGDETDFEEQALDPEAYEPGQVLFAYMASRGDLNYDGLVKLFHEYRGLFLADVQVKE